MVWMDSRNETFSAKALYSVLELGRSVPFSMGAICNLWVSKSHDFISTFIFTFPISLETFASTI